MSRTTRRSLLRNPLSALIALDLLALAALVANQWFAVSAGVAWGIAAALALPVFALARPVSATVLAMADRYAGIPNTGEQIPEAGQ